ncbi:MAG TPA: cysteine--tRNA ligase [Sphingomonas sp.]|uniref:cysteine--tRNA ligase n=1 Tax=Sphingomonas sp. TaxID=28214 RepID=UPI002C7C2BCB|nr:cysteine--tRNA ligase [Sphingomonas sp.]HMI18996.1 cysteine--tRNA ligase [Sphingomonas sp.]
MTTLTLFNSLSRSLEPFAPSDGNTARVYSCGPTVYNFAHLGNLRAYVFTDTLRRTLLFKGWDVRHVINITDVGHLTSDADAGEDKMELAAAGLGKDIWEVAAFYTAAFKRNLADLNILSPTIWSVATDHVAEMIAFAEKIAPDHCYEIESGLYFDVSTVPDYGRLARSVSDEGESRIDPVSGKRNPQDFAIWRKSPSGEQRQMEWDSPWGRGAPGWHLECSVMSLQYLGPEPFDIHTGGIDHREIHHPNEIAQNQAYCDCSAEQPGFTGARFWLHNNFLVDRSGKMSKSGGGFTTLQSLIDAGVHPLAYRLLCLSSHYRSELEFSGDAVSSALTRLRRIVAAIEKLKKSAQRTEWRPFEHFSPPPPISSHQDSIVDEDDWFDFTGVLTEFDQKVSNDLNTPAVMPLLEEVLVDPVLVADNKLRLLATMDQVVGLNLLNLTRADLRVRPATATLTPETIETRLDERQQARAAKDFARSDAIRDELIAAGVEVMDGDPLRWEWRVSL